MDKLEIQISDTIAREIDQRERAIEAARQQAGAFPILSGASSGSAGKSPTSSDAQFTPRPSTQTHKVLSLNSKTKKVIVSSYTTTPVPSRPVSRAESVEEEPHRIPPPPSDVEHVKAVIDESRPWRNLKDLNVNYIPPIRVDDEGTGSRVGKRSRRNRGKAKENASGDGAGGSNDNQ